MPGAITDVSGIKVGHAQNMEAATGCTVVIFEKGAVAGVDVRGGAPGTRETDLLDPVNLVDKVFAIYLGGGSAFGLDGAGGVMQYLEEHDVGFDTVVAKVPIVPGAVLFDLGIGSSKIRPDREMGYEACLNAAYHDQQQGNVGAGAGATVGKIFGMGRAMKSGLGTSSISTGSLVIGALVAVNSFGSVLDWQTGEILAGTLTEDRKAAQDTGELMRLNAEQTYGFPGTNTTLAVVATNAKFDKAGASKLASMAQNGFARSIKPCHTMFDGDSIFTLCTSEIEADLSLAGSLAVDALAEAVKQAVIAAKGIHRIPAYQDLAAGRA